MIISFSKGNLLHCRTLAVQFLYFVHERQNIPVWNCVQAKLIILPTDAIVQCQLFLVHAAKRFCLTLENSLLNLLDGIVVFGAQFLFHILFDDCLKD